MCTSTEMTFSDEHDASTARRAFIKEGYAASLVALDPSRDLYVFDLSPKPTEDQPVNEQGCPVCRNCGTPHYMHGWVSNTGCYTIT